MFNKFSLLSEFPEHKQLQMRIENLANRLQCTPLQIFTKRKLISPTVPLGKIYLVDGSKRSAHSNAYFTGLPFLTKQSSYIPRTHTSASDFLRLVVLFDTLIKEQTPEQIEGVLAHELGHWKHNDTVRLMAMGQASAFVTFTAIAGLLFNSGSSNRFLSP